MKQKIVLSGEDRVKLRVGQRRSFFIDIAAKFFLSFQFDAAVAAVIDTDAVLFAQQYTGVLFIVGGVPIIVKIQAADEVTAILCMRVQFEQGRDPRGQRGFISP